MKHKSGNVSERKWHFKGELEDNLAKLTTEGCIQICEEKGFEGENRTEEYTR